MLLFPFECVICFHLALSTKVLKTIFSVKTQADKFFDQKVLRWMMWPLTVNHTLVHDSYWCKRALYWGPEWRPFPTQVIYYILSKFLCSILVCLISLSILFLINPERWLHLPWLWSNKTHQPCIH